MDADAMERLARQEALLTSQASLIHQLQQRTEYLERIVSGQRDVASAAEPPNPILENGAGDATAVVEAQDLVPIDQLLGGFNLLHFLQRHPSPLRELGLCVTACGAGERVVGRVALLKALPHMNADFIDRCHAAHDFCLLPTLIDLRLLTGDLELPDGLCPEWLMRQVDQFGPVFNPRREHREQGQWPNVAISGDLLDRIQMALHLDEILEAMGSQSTSASCGVCLELEPNSDFRRCSLDLHRFCVGCIRAQALAGAQMNAPFLACLALGCEGTMALDGLELPDFVVANYAHAASPPHPVFAVTIAASEASSARAESEPGSAMPPPPPLIFDDEEEPRQQGATSVTMSMAETAIVTDDVVAETEKAGEPDKKAESPSSASSERTESPGHSSSSRGSSGSVPTGVWKELFRVRRCLDLMLPRTSDSQTQQQIRNFVDELDQNERECRRNVPYPTQDAANRKAVAVRQLLSTIRSFIDNIHHPPEGPQSTQEEETVQEPIEEPPNTELHTPSSPALAIATSTPLVDEDEGSPLKTYIPDTTHVPLFDISDDGGMPDLSMDVAPSASDSDDLFSFSEPPARAASMEVDAPTPVASPLPRRPASSLDFGSLGSGLLLGSLSMADLLCCDCGGRSSNAAKSDCYLCKGKPRLLLPPNPHRITPVPLMPTPLAPPLQQPKALRVSKGRGVPRRSASLPGSDLAERPISQLSEQNQLAVEATEPQPMKPMMGESLVGDMPPLVDAPLLMDAEPVMNVLPSPVTDVPSLMDADPRMDEQQEMGTEPQMRETMQESPPVCFEPEEDPIEESRHLGMPDMRTPLVPTTAQVESPPEEVQASAQEPVTSDSSEAVSEATLPKTPTPTPEPMERPVSQLRSGLPELRNVARPAVSSLPVEPPRQKRLPPPLKPRPFERDPGRRPDSALTDWGAEFASPAQPLLKGPEREELQHSLETTLRCIVEACGESGLHFSDMEGVYKRNSNRDLKSDIGQLGIENMLQLLVGPRRVPGIRFRGDIRVIIPDDGKAKGALSFPRSHSVAAHGFASRH